jgi:hypothetical protein
MGGFIQRAGGVPPAPGGGLLPFDFSSFDHFALSYDSNDNLIQVLCYRTNKLITTVTLMYDANDNLIDVKEM